MTFILGGNMENITTIDYFNNEIDLLTRDNCVEILKRYIHSGEEIKKIVTLEDYYKFIVFFNEEVLYSYLLTSSNTKYKLSICTEFKTLESIIKNIHMDIVLHIIKKFLRKCLETSIREIEVEEQLKNGMEVIHDFSINSTY